MASSSKQDRGILEERAGDGDALLLAAGEHHAALADDGVVASGKLGDEVVDQRGAGGGFDLGLRRAGAAEADVLGDGAGEHHRLLLDIGKARAEVGGVEVADVDAVDEDGAGVDVVEALDEAEDGGLTRARCADQRDGLAFRHGEGQLVDDLLALAGLVGEVDILEAQRALRR